MTLGDRIKSFVKKRYVLGFALGTFILSVLTSPKAGFQPSWLSVLLLIPMGIYIGAQILLDTDTIGSSKK